MSKLELSTIRKYFWAYLMPVLWAGFIFFCSAQESLPGLSISIFEFIFKKSAHMFVFAILYVLLLRAYCKTNKKKIDKNTYLLFIIICLLYAISDEFHQSNVPGRHPALRDIGFDMLGTTTVLLYQLKII